MTAKDREILETINKYAEEVLGDIDPQKVPVSQQLETLKPIMEELAGKHQMELADMFILYMDLQSEAAAKSQAKLQEDFADINSGDGPPLLFR